MRHDHDLGLQHDMAVLLGRRRLLRLLAGAGLVAVAGCAPGGGPPGGGAVAAGAAGEIPQETAGPFPGDGSNGPNVLTQSGIVRADIAGSFGSSTGTAQGVPLRVELTLTDVAGAPMPSAALYLWHCDREGRYSLYEVEDQNYLRGVQQADQAGRVVFTSIFPGAYAGRWPHMHFEVYPDLGATGSADKAITTSQLALPQEICQRVYDTAAGYGDSVTNLGLLNLASDNVFRDGYQTQLAAVTGSVEAGLVASLTMPVAA